VTLSSHQNASSSWIILWLISGLADHGMIPGDEGAWDWSEGTVESTQTGSNP
jgi:hypothetical protein